MAVTNLPILLTTLGVGHHEFEPVIVDDTAVRATITIDRTVTDGIALGLNGQPDTTQVEIGIWQSDDGGATWLFRASAGLIGGTIPNLYLFSNVSVDLNPTTGRWVKATIDVAGASVAVLGSLVIQ